AAELLDLRAEKRALGHEPIAVALLLHAIAHPLVLGAACAVLVIVEHTHGIVLPMDA
ncbi:hypothetical protein SPRG_09187, partial [Saprolegnia parasitica CBS 223.65]